MAATVPTTVLVISDTHLAHPLTAGLPAKLPPIDLLIHAGDLTMQGTVPEFHRVLDMLATISADVKLVIPGNHDLALDSEWMLRSDKKLRAWEMRSGVREWKGQLSLEYCDMARALWFGDDSRAVYEGVTMLVEGTHEILLKNGASVKVSRVSLSLLMNARVDADGTSQKQYGRCHSSTV